MKYAEHPKFNNIVALCGLWRFRRIDKLPGFKQKNSPYLVVLNVQKCLQQQVTVSETPVDLGLLRVYYLSSLNFQFGYLFEIPKLSVNIATNFIRVIKPEHKKTDHFEGVEVKFSNAHFSVFNAQDKAVLVSFNQHHQYLSTEDKND